MTSTTHETRIVADPDVPLVRIVRDFDAPPGCFHEVRPDKLIVQTFTFDDMPDGVAPEKLVLVTSATGGRG